MIEYGLSLGSNLGDRLGNLTAARDGIAGLDKTQILASSRVYETDPVDVLPEYADLTYLNAVVIAASGLAPAELARRLHALEAGSGRIRSDDRNAPRPLDIDIIYGGDIISRDEPLRLPHPRWHERRFVVAPLCDVRPELILPGMDRTVQQILLALPDEPKVVVSGRQWAGTDDCRPV